MMTGTKTLMLIGAASRMVASPSRAENLRERGGDACSDAHEAAAEVSRAAAAEVSRAAGAAAAGVAGAGAAGRGEGPPGQRE